MQDIEDIEDKYRAPAQQREAVLRKWIKKNGSEASYRVLYDALMKLNERGAAEQILKLLVSETKH